MTTQAALIFDTIIGLKRALRREYEDTDILFLTDAGPDDPITQPTNRGNKMKANAKYVSQGALGHINGEEFYKEKVEHAGYKRCILQRNPIRYDSEGEELDEEEEDSEADAAAAEENPFSGIALETLLCPLKHPSELSTHPSLSQAYSSQALEQMTKKVEEKLRQERALLWRARNLHREFLGDIGWMPCGAVETPEDRYIFDPRVIDDSQRMSGQQHPIQNGTSSAGGVTSAPQEIHTQFTNGDQQTQNQVGNESRTENNDVAMAEVPAGDLIVNNYSTGQNISLKSEEADAAVNDLPPHLANEEVDKDREMVDPESTHSNHNEGDAEMHDGSSPSPPRRMTTRARASAANPQDGQSPLSSADTASTMPTAHPLFIIPDNIRPDPNYGLPALEAEETRRLLWSYIQKQEETVRGFEHMLDSLLRACRMKANVLEWSKAEGHVGEMSDGEDWYDREKWGLAEGEDLKKGTDEDEVEVADDSRTTAKRGRGRRA
ncbi:hypothetical protein N7495_001766 [Penicillium taxi]|uniref:uncharacterized protein n=1 Tax=Penicillium taxi TaxID=168475 RepID=UPI002544D7CB|nr:uncharacterized protein N7495_001766 [Penicillium taxi]KAJ5909084.1 hypothetical protein N7495_001766 [Penicillium taxi]